MKKRIKELVRKVQIGYQFERRVDPSPEGTHRVIQARDIDENFKLQVKDLCLVTPRRPAERYLIDKGDVLFLSKGNYNWASSIEEPLDKTIASGYFFILKPGNDGLVSSYMAWYLNQAPAQNYLKSIASGSRMPMIRKPDFMELEVEVPPIATQKTIIKLDELRQKESRLLKQLAEKRSNMLLNICLKAVGAARD